VKAHEHFTFNNSTEMQYKYKKEELTL